MHLLSDILTYIRRIIKSPSNNVINDNLLIDYVNRFWISDVDARMQLFDLKTKYQFQTVPGVDQYNMPLYNIQPDSAQAASSIQSPISFYPVYQGFLDPCYINGVLAPLQTRREAFFNNNWNVVQNLECVARGDGVSSNYTFNVPIISNEPQIPLNPPLQGLLRGHVDITGIISTGNNIDPPTGTTINLAIPSTSIYPAVYITAIDANGNSVVVQDSGQFLSTNANVGLLMNPGPAPFGYSAMSNGYVTSFAITGATQANLLVLTTTSTFAIGQQVTINNVLGMTELNGNTYTVTANSGTTLTLNVNSTAFAAYVSGGTASSIANYVNYFTGQVNVTFPSAIPAGNFIGIQCYYFQSGLPRTMLYYNNVLTLRSPPDRQYLVELDAYLSPSAFLNTSQAVQFGYMSEYIARGAARKILSDTGDIEQFQFYEPLFREQEILVWKRSQRQFTNNRTQTIYSQGSGMGQNFSNNSFGGTSS
jgi:hypothetical protein